MYLPYDTYSTYTRQGMVDVPNFYRLGSFMLPDFSLFVSLLRETNSNNTYWLSLLAFTTGFHHCVHHLGFPTALYGPYGRMVHATNMVLRETSQQPCVRSFGAIFSVVESVSEVLHCR